VKRLVLLLGLSLAGCGPSLSTLVSQKHYREAICAGGTDEAVSRALFDDTNPYVNLHALTDEEVSTVLPDPAKAADVTSRARFVRFTLETNRIPVDGMRLAVTTTPAIVTWPSLETFAELTGENLPPPRTYTTDPSFFGNLALVLVTGGVWLFTDPFTPRRYSVPLPDEVYQKAAPNAFALHRATTGQASCERTNPQSAADAPVGLRCSTYFLLARPVDRALTLNFTFEYAASRIRRDTDHGADADREENRCFSKHTVHVPIGTEAALPQWTRATFGTKPRRLAELARP